MKDGYLFTVRKGYGNDLKDEHEGIHYKNFFGTYLLGPLLIRNPYLLDDGNIGWVNNDCIVGKVNPEPTPEPTELQIGDTVEIINTGKASIYGDEPTAYGIGWTRIIKNIYEGASYPYEVGDETGTTGFYTADALRKI